MSTHHELPPDKHQTLLKAVRLEWTSIAYLVTAITLLYFTLGSSQAMKAAWVEDILGLTPPIAFLVASRIRNRKPNDRFPYGYHRATAIAYLCASMALLTLGAFILYDSVSKLIKFEHPPIDLVKPFGDRPVWLGWLMLGALAYSTAPQVLLGRLKQPLAKELNDKYKALTGTDLDHVSATNLTAAAVVVDALRRTQSASRDALRDALEQTDLKVGDGYWIIPEGCKFDERNHNARQVYLVSQWQNGVQKVIYPEQYATAEAVWPVRS